jgi:hypothetical protein
VKVDVPLGGNNPNLDAASVFAHKHYLVGARVVHALGGANSAPSIEAKLGCSCDKNQLALSAARNNKGVQTFGASYFHHLGDNRSLAAKLDFNPGEFSLGNVSLATSNKVNDDVTVKARFNTRGGTLAFAATNNLNKNVTVEFGSEFNADMSGASIYNVRLIYNN